MGVAASNHSISVPVIRYVQLLLLCYRTNSQGSANRATTVKTRNKTNTNTQKVCLTRNDYNKITCTFYQLLSIRYKNNYNSITLAKGLTSPANT